MNPHRQRLLVAAKADAGWVSGPCVCEGVLNSGKRYFSSFKLLVQLRTRAKPELQPRRQQRTRRIRTPSRSQKPKRKRKRKPKEKTRQQESLPQRLTAMLYRLLCNSYLALFAWMLLLLGHAACLRLEEDEPGLGNKEKKSRPAGYVH